MESIKTVTVFIPVGPSQGRSGRGEVVRGGGGGGV